MKRRENGLNYILWFTGYTSCRFFYKKNTVWIDPYVKGKHKKRIYVRDSLLTVQNYKDIEKAINMILNDPQSKGRYEIISQKGQIIPVNIYSFKADK